MRGLGPVRALAVVAGGFIAVLAVLAASGCASLSGKECRTGDWEAIGRADGERGASGNEIEDHQKACARHEVPVSEDAWRAGYAKGLETFCTPKGGYLAAREGRKHNDACFGFDSEARFLESFGHGQDVHKLVSEIRQLSQLKRDLEMALLSGEYSDYEFSQLRMRAAVVESEIGRRRWELNELDQRHSAEYGVPPLARSD